MKNNKVILWSVTVALAGFLFGFDTIVINGADKPIQDLWQTSDWFHSTFIMSMALWGTVIGALCGGFPTKRFGRKKTLFWIGIFYLVSALGSSMATDPYLFSFFRFLGGLGVGASSVAAPIYISEIAPRENRGKLVALYQFNIVLGILIAFLSNWLIGKYMAPAVSWRWMLGIEALPALLYSLVVLTIAESPRWLLLTKGDRQGARAVLANIFSSEKEVEEQLQIIEDSRETAERKTAGVSFFSARHRWPIFLAFLLAMFNQLSGINFVFYYATRIMQEAGMTAETARASGIWLGLINFLFTFVGLYLIDRMGRKSLMYIGSIGYIVFLSLVAYAFATGTTGGWVVVMVCGFIAAHAVGQGAVIWVFISEIFPNQVRDFGMAWGSGTHWVFAATITMITLPVLNAFSATTVFGFFAFCMVLQLLFVHFMMPETKGVSLEELQKQLTDNEA
ncbi:sugar porter family MFS transporter [Lewinella cohaerens]|uniref:sugar porter family MFS transporter n=1 Tax=Lewinella cohaerens TaxID=70995 RepID=UPI000371A214|nr:sugar porter family MFS transporter [Lewinella cohaerens]